MANQKKQSDKTPDVSAGLGDIANLVLGKLDEHGVTLEQAVAAIQAASKNRSKKPAAKKAPAKKEEAKSKAVITMVSGHKDKQSTTELEGSMVYQLSHGIG